MLLCFASDRISRMAVEFSTVDLMQFRGNFEGALTDISTSSDPRVQRTLRRFRAAVIAQGSDYTVGEAVRQAVAEDFTKVIDRESLAGTQYIDRGGHLNRSGQAEADLNRDFLQDLRFGGILVIRRGPTAEIFAGATLGETSSQNLSDISRERLVDRIGVALTKYVDQRYFPQTPLKFS